VILRMENEAHLDLAGEGRMRVAAPREKLV